MAEADWDIVGPECHRYRRPNCRAMPNWQKRVNSSICNVCQIKLIQIIYKSKNNLIFTEI